MPSSILCVLLVHATELCLRERLSKLGEAFVLTDIHIHIYIYRYIKIDRVILAGSMLVR